MAGATARPPAAAPMCATASAIAGTTVNGAAVQPAFWTDSYEGEEYGIMSLSVASAVGEGGRATAGQRRSLLGKRQQKKKDGKGDGSAAGRSLTVCIKLKRKGPCSTAAQFCFGGDCVFTIKDRRERCCPTRKLV